MKLYLAHNFGSRFKVRDEITPIIKKLFPDYEIDNPFLREGRENHGIYETTTNSEKVYKRKAQLNSVDVRDEWIVVNDIEQLEKCDMLVAYVERASFGTACEIFHNSWHLKRRTITIFDTRIDLSYHPWINYLSTEMIFLDEVD